MSKAFPMVAVVALLAGCATSQVPFNQAKPVPEERVLAYQRPPAGPHGTIQVSRDTGLMGAPCFVAVHIDGHPVARIGTGEGVSLFLPVGDHLVGMGADEQGSGPCSWAGPLKEQAAALTDGQVRRFRIGGNTNTGLDIRPSSF